MKSALITGGGRRIGGAIARDLAAHGWAVALQVDGSADQAASLTGEIVSGGGRAIAIAADVRQPEACARLLESAFGLLPGLELVVINGAIAVDDDARTCCSSALAEAFAVNAIGPIMMAQRFAALLPEGRTGALVNILDNRALAPRADYFSHGVSTLAAFGAMRMLALGLAPRIRVNGIAPGLTPTGLEPTGAATSQVEASCTPEEMAGAVRLVAGSPAMTGAVITMNAAGTWNEAADI
jgi:NAD(P)-dependent dehydrogenase (short-subunit alcohol dehydrogenase family)